MPTVTVAALDTLLESRSSSSPSSAYEHQRRIGITDGDHNGEKPGYPRRRGCTVSSTFASSPKLDQIVDQHHHFDEIVDEHPALVLAPQPRDSSPSAMTSPHNSRPNGIPERNGQASSKGAGARGCTTCYFISPKLYAIPDSAQIALSGSNSASSPTFDCSIVSPYVVNHKRRGVPLALPPPPGTSLSAVDGDDSIEGKHLAHTHTPKMLDDQRGSNAMPDEAASCSRHGDWEAVDVNKHPDVDGHELFNPQYELMSSMSGGDADVKGGSFRQIRAGRYYRTVKTANHSEFYDASEDFISEDPVSHSSSSFHANADASIFCVHYDLAEDIDRRRKAEEVLALTQHIFQRLARQLSQVGMSIPCGRPVMELQCDVNLMTQFCQELVVTRFVFEAIEVSLAHAEAQAAADFVIEAKNHEITRLQDRLRYHEAMNREMSLRNQAAVELARQRRLRRKAWRRWAWGCAGLSVAVGASLLAYSYFPFGDRNPSPSPGESSDF